MLKAVALLCAYLLTSAFVSIGNAQNSTCLSEDSIQDMRLVDGPFGDFMGRVEIRFNGTWGTICDNGWSRLGADVVCRTLGYERAVCAVTRAGLGAGPNLSPIWMSQVRCSSNDNCLQDCSFIGLDKPLTSCSHGEDAGVICNPNTGHIPPPNDLTLVNSTISTLTVGFTKISNSLIPAGTSNVRYRIIYVEDITEVRRTTFINHDDNDDEEESATKITRVLSNLKRNTSYTFQIGVQIRYSVRLCFSFVDGPLSDAVTLRTNDTARMSDVAVRLTPNEDYPEFMGRVEVNYNETWGIVCNDRFSLVDGNVICRAMNYHRAICVPFRTTTLSQGPVLPIWLDQLTCPASAEIVEDCSHNGWGVHNCRASDAASVICDPGDDYLGAPTEITADLRGSSVLISWQAANIPRLFPQAVFQYQMSIQPIGERFRIFRAGIAHDVTEFEVTNLVLGITYTVTMRLQASFRPCLFSFYQGPLSEPTNFTTIPIAPEGPPTRFHLTVLNSTAVELQWNAPLLSLQNGDITGYIVFASTSDGTEEMHDFPRNSSEYDVAIVGDLTPSTRYSFSVLAYNVAGQGPRSEFIIQQTFAEGEEPIINSFGVNGNELNIGVRFTFQRDIHIHCGSKRPHVEIDWFDSNGVKIGIDDRNLREAHYSNGTTILQVAASRRLSECDGGVYTCVANDSQTGFIQSRNFTLIIGDRPGSINRPYPIAVQSDSVQVGWDEAECDGGHNIVGYTLRFAENDNFLGSLVDVTGISVTNYTARDLRPDTLYGFRIMRETAEGDTGILSDVRFIMTLPPAPSPPRDVTFRIVSNTEIEVSWRAPMDAQGVIVQYTVYVLVTVSGSPTKRQLPETQQVLTEVFEGNRTSGNITVPSAGVTYSVEVTATIMTGDDTNEGARSFPVDILLPEPDVPVLQGFTSIAATNSSITLQWKLPLPPFLPVDYYSINLTAVVEGTGSGIQVTESRTIQVPSPNQRVTVEPLTPGTGYMFSIAAVSDGQMGVPAFTDKSTYDVVSANEKLSFLQLRFGPIHQCSSFETTGSGRLGTFEGALIASMNLLCNCGLTVDNLQNGTFNCPNGLVDKVVYRARILGNSRYSARDLLALAQRWVATGQAAVHVEVFRFNIDPQCRVDLDSLSSPHCQFTKTPGSSPAEVSSGEYSLLIITLLIIGALLAAIILLTVMILRKSKPLKNRRNLVPSVRFVTNPTPDDVEPFADQDGNSRDSTLFEEKPSL